MPLRVLPIEAIGCARNCKPPLEGKIALRFRRFGARQQSLWLLFHLAKDQASALEAGLFSGKEKEIPVEIKSSTPDLLASADIEVWRLASPSTLEQFYENIEKGKV